MKDDAVAIAPGVVSYFANRVASADLGSTGEPLGNRVVTAFGFEHRRDADLFSGAHEFEMAFVTNATLYGWTGNTVRGFRRHGKQLIERSSFVIEGAARIYDGTSMTVGVAFDTDAGTFYASPGSTAFTCISDAPNVIVRAFNQSRHYTHQIWSVKEDHVEIAVLR